MTLTNKHYGLSSVIRSITVCYFSSTIPVLQQFIRRVNPSSEIKQTKLFLVRSDNEEKRQIKRLRFSNFFSVVFQISDVRLLFNKCLLVFEDFPDSIHVCIDNKKKATDLLNVGLVEKFILYLSLDSFTRV